MLSSLNGKLQKHLEWSTNIALAVLVKLQERYPVKYLVGDE